MFSFCNRGITLVNFASSCQLCVVPQKYQTINSVWRATGVCRNAFWRSTEQVREFRWDTWENDIDFSSIQLSPPTKALFNCSYCSQTSNRKYCSYFRWLYSRTNVSFLICISESHTRVFVSAGYLLRDLLKGSLCCVYEFDETRTKHRRRKSSRSIFGKFGFVHV